jgi:hypothetical protein
MSVKYDPVSRHSLVSLLSSTGLAMEDISDLVGHANTRVTESVYRKELLPTVHLLGGAARVRVGHAPGDDNQPNHPGKGEGPGQQDQDRVRF